MSLITLRQLIGKSPDTGRGTREVKSDRVAVMSYLRPEQATTLYAIALADNVPVTRLMREAVDLFLRERACRPAFFIEVADES